MMIGSMNVKMRWQDKWLYYFDVVIQSFSVHRGSKDVCILNPGFEYDYLNVVSESLKWVMFYLAIYDGF